MIKVHHQSHNINWGTHLMYSIDDKPNFFLVIRGSGLASCDQIE